MKNEPFDIESFMQEMRSGDAPLSAKREAQSDAVKDIMPRVVAEVAPRIWAVIQKEMSRDPTSNAYLNAVLNSAVIATLSLVAASTPEGSTNGEANADILRRTVNSSLEIAIANSKGAAPSILTVAKGAGALKLVKDTSETVAEALLVNSLLLKSLSASLKK